MINVIACGAHTPAGLNVNESFGSHRAGLTRIKRYPAHEDRNWEPVRVGIIEYIPETLPYVDRFIDIGLPALEEALEGYTELNIKDPLPVYIGLPEDRPGFPIDTAVQLEKGIRQFANQAGIPVNLHWTPHGHASGFLDLKQIREDFEEEKYGFALVGGIDSYMAPETLEWLEERGRLYCSYKSSGFIPGEGAAFCLLASDKELEKYKLKSKARILGFGHSLEDHCHGSKSVNLGKGLTCSVREALKELPDDQAVQQIFCALNGEDYHSMEWGYTAMALASRLENPMDFIPLTKPWGDVGSATAPLLMAHAIHAGEWGYARGPLCLAFASSLGKERGAALLEIEINEKRRKKWQ